VDFSGDRVKFSSGLEIDSSIVVEMWSGIVKALTSLALKASYKPQPQTATRNDPNRTLISMRNIPKLCCLCRKYWPFWISTKKKPGPVRCAAESKPGMAASAVSFVFAFRLFP